MVFLAYRKGFPMQATGPARSDAPRPGLSTVTAAIPETACSGGETVTQQHYELYSEADHSAWRYLYSRHRELWAQHANERFLEGLQGLRLPEERVPRLEDVTAFLTSHSGFRAEAVSGCVPKFEYFDRLRNRRLPAASAIRSADSPDSGADPDIFHDLAGHAPMHVDRSFTQALIGLGNCAHTAIELAGGIRDPVQRWQRLNSQVRGLLRFHFFTVEFGLVRYGNLLKAYGSGLLSSAGDIEGAVVSPRVQRSDLHLDWVIHQPYEPGPRQPLLFIVESFDQFLELTVNLEEWMRAGRLDHVSGGKPEVSAADLDSFLSAAGSRPPSYSQPLRHAPLPLSHRRRPARRRKPANLP